MFYDVLSLETIGLIGSVLAVLGIISSFIFIDCVLHLTSKEGIWGSDSFETLFATSGVLAFFLLIFSLGIFSIRNLSETKFVEIAEIETIESENGDIQYVVKGTDGEEYRIDEGDVTIKISKGDTNYADISVCKFLHSDGSVEVLNATISVDTALSEK